MKNCTFDHHRSKHRKTVSKNILPIFSLLFVVSMTGCSQQHTTTTIEKGNNVAPQEVAAKPIQVGWMTSWATTGQIMQAMIHTNIATLEDVPLIFRSFLFGPDINEAALHGEVDCVNNGLVPTISLLSASGDWVIVGRLIDSPLSVVARKGSGIETMQDLKGKSIAVPFGGGSHPFVIQLLAENGLQMGEGKGKVHLLNLKPSEQAIAMQQGSVDAVGTWEPQTAIMLARNLGKVIKVERHIGVITVRKSIAQNKPEEIVRLLKAYIQANYYVATHKEETDEWFADAAHMDNNVLKFIKVIEPNTKAKTVTAIDIKLTPDDIKLGQRFADTMYKAELIPTQVDFNSRTDQSFLQTALKELATAGYQTSNIKEVAIKK